MLINKLNANLVQFSFGGTFGFCGKWRIFPKGLAPQNWGKEVGHVVSSDILSADILGLLGFNPLLRVVQWIERII